MADTENTTDSATISMEDYKKLQRKLDRTHKTNRKLQSEVAENRASAARQEQMLESLMKISARGDTELKPLVEEYLGAQNTRRSHDTASVSATQRIFELLDESDEDWEDEKFAQARTRLAEATESGDASKYSEVVKMVQDTVSPVSATYSADDIKEIVRQALQGEKTDERRVDTGSSTASTSKSVRLSDLSPDLNKVSLADAEETLKEALKFINE